MSLSSPFEVARSTHEEAERYAAALASVLATIPPSSSAPPTRSTLTNSHIASLLADRIVSRNRALIDFYEDQTGIRKEEIDLLSGKTSSIDAGGASADAGGSSTTTTTTSEVMSLFYSRLNHIKSYHEKYPTAPPEVLTLDIPSLENSIAPSTSSSIGTTTTSAMDRLFSGEEGLGRYLDLNEYHSQYINLRGIKRCNYLAYLERFHDFARDDITPETKQGDGFQKHLTSLRSYLIGYLRKIKPLDDIDTLVEDIEAEFEGKWAVGEVRGWEDQGQKFASISSSSSSTGRSATSTTGTAASAPIPRPENDTGIWCDVCGKSFSKQTVFDGHLQGNKHKKALERQNGGASSSSVLSSNTGSSSKTNAAREALLKQAKVLAKHEYLIYTLCTGPLQAHRLDTRTNVERRAALTERERAAEAEELARLAEDPSDGGSRRPRPRGREAGEEEDGGSSSSDENEKIYNPKKLPLGWDGRPIPVWLYKLHGLSVDFSCEICSDFTYQGRKNFDRHFTESRHAFGMRALGLPNTKHFHGITRIEDAIKLAEKLKKLGKNESGNSGGGAGGGGGGGDTSMAVLSALGGSGRDIEEVEDEQGNTYSRKDYELLKRQGLI